MHSRSRIFAFAQRVHKVSADHLLRVLAGVEQPENDEQGHHGGYEIGIGHLPCAAMVRSVARFLLDDDDGVDGWFHCWSLCCRWLGLSGAPGTASHRRLGILETRPHFM